MLKGRLGRNRIGRIGRIPIGKGTDTIRLQRVRFITHSCRFVSPAIEKKMRAYRGLGRDRIGRTGPYRIGAQLPIRSKHNRIGGFIGNYRKFRHENRALDEGGAPAAASPQAGASKRRRSAGRRAICSVWLLEGREIVALTEETAAIRWPGGSVTIYRRNNKPAFGPVGDSLEDLQ